LEKSVELSTAITSPLITLNGHWWAYAIVLGIIGIMLIVDLGVFHRKPHAVTLKEAAIWSIIWVAISLLFNFGLWHWATEYFVDQPGVAKRLAGEFLAGYVVEKTLAIDNIFVIAVIFSYFAIPSHLQHRVLFYGIIGAIFFRAIFIGLGSWLMQYHWVMYVFGGFLILTGLKLFRPGDENKGPGDNLLVRWVTKRLPATPDLHGASFFVRSATGSLMVTPLFLALIVVEFTDIIFAVDSVPAIFAITNEPFIVFSSNMFAILGLRSMYFLLGSLMPMFTYLKYGLGLILIFVGLKMAWLNQLFGGKFPISWSLGIIAAILTTSIVASIVSNKKKTKRETRISNT
jgi:tellurite resistance protein TerC